MTWAEDAAVVRKTDKNVETVKVLVLKNCEVSNTFRTSFGSLQSILKSEYTSKCHKDIALHAAQQAEGALCQHMPDLGRIFARHPEFLLKINSGDKNQNGFK